MTSLFKRSPASPVIASPKTSARTAFSLVEVVVAVGIFAIGIVGVLGLLSPSIKSVSEVGDTAVANRLADNIQVELERLGFTYISDPARLGTSSNTLTLVANRDGSRVLLSTVADNDVVNGSPPGILNRNRYYGITVQQLSSLPYTAGSGFIALSVRVVWPYQIPNTTDDTSTKASQEVESVGTAAGTWKKATTAQQSVMLLNMALRP
ncbi:MAG: hypothetical protein WC661_13435 [Opitutaceae bacterium]|jgi:type II secretory pathway pseudopilin PulG